MITPLKMKSLDGWLNQSRLDAFLPVICLFLEILRVQNTDLTRSFSAVENFIYFPNQNLENETAFT